MGLVAGKLFLRTIAIKHSVLKYDERIRRTQVLIVMQTFILEAQWASTE